MVYRGITQDEINSIIDKVNNSPKGLSSAIKDMPYIWRIYNDNDGVAHPDRDTNANR